MRTLAFVSPTLLAFALAGCDFSLGIEIMNAGNEDVQISAGSKSEKVQPGLSFKGIWPSKEDSNKEILVSSGRCKYEYPVPNLDQEPWTSLIGDSVKFRWFEDGRLVAYPPTPDVRLVNNPQRAISEDKLTIQPSSTSCQGKANFVAR
jgi:hypothetical protein